jgi:hypothetical protein
MAGILNESDEEINELNDDEIDGIDEQFNSANFTLNGMNDSCERMLSDWAPYI